ncbi:platelet-derived growth factor subunit A-like isoform X2 [Heterodontus francisci]|uniref:platelet-derived growth factor subunit A-like isoform X2 n=1 Tax=Heterodontus francisci TaxID=7792 RepID=UPI00355B153D
MDLLQKTTESNMKSQLLVFLSLFCFWTVISEQMPKSMNAEEGLPEDVLRMIAQADIRSINDLEDLLGIEAKDSSVFRPEYRIGVPLWLGRHKGTNEHPGQKASNEGRSSPPLHLTVTQEPQPQSQHRSFIAGYASPKPAGCKPRVVSVEVPRYKVDPTSVGFFLWPSCVEIQRCSGCCNTKTYKCIPSLAKYKPFQIAKLTYRYGRQELTKHTVTIREHLSCNCTELARFHQPRFPPKYYRQSTDN